MTSASIMGWSQSPATASYGYDGIGNHTLWGGNAVTNEYAHNSLNQMVGRVVLNAPGGPQSSAAAYTPNGGLASDGDWLYAYDAEDRLVSVTSASLTNGALRVESAYDWRDRRISKTVSRYDSTAEGWNIVERRVFTYDDWNLVHETIMQIGGTVPTATEVQYFWGLDLSETLQGAGGVGGLLAVSVNGSFYIPCYDNNGNVTKYIDESGSVAASYAYDDFGRIIAQSGSLADVFPHRFSTKYFDAETGLCYYGRRFYSPLLKRWLNRDPIEEAGGLNLYLSCCNRLPSLYDVLGTKWVIRRKGEDFAIAIPCNEGDAFEVLADNVGLDYSDYTKWAHTSDQKPVAGRRYRIPNTVYYHFGDRRECDDERFALYSSKKGELWRGVARDMLYGYHVVVENNVSSGEMEAALSSDGIYRYTFLGHGGETYINTYPEDRECLGPKRYTKYGINQLNLYACQSAALDKQDENVLRRERRIVWRSNVAKVGTFTGYTRSVVLATENLFIITVGGMNETGKENVKRKKGMANERK